MYVYRASIFPLPSAHFWSAREISSATRLRIVQSLFPSCRVEFEAAFLDQLYTKYFSFSPEHTPLALSNICTAIHARETHGSTKATFLFSWRHRLATSNVDRTFGSLLSGVVTAHLCFLLQTSVPLDDLDLQKHMRNLQSKPHPLCSMEMRSLESMISGLLPSSNKGCLL